jgi:hypothetical protein
VALDDERFAAATKAQLLLTLKLELLRVQPVVVPTLTEELGVSALFGNVPIFDDQDAVRPADRR